MAKDPDSTARSLEVVIAAEDDDRELEAILDPEDKFLIRKSGSKNSERKISRRASWRAHPPFNTFWQGRH